MANTPPELHGLLTEYRRRLEARFGGRLRRVHLYGSRSRGEAAPDSDVDVAVVVADLTEAECAEGIDLALEAWRASGRNGPLIDPLVWSEAQWNDRRQAERRIALDIEREGVPV
jgi:predicted nucleotidyltransferase